MIHGFDDSNKEKVEMYSKEDFLVLTSDEVTVAQEASGEVTLSIHASLKNYVVISLMGIMDHSSDGYYTYELPSRDFYITGAKIKINGENGTSNDFLRVFFINRSDGTYKYRIRAVLMKVG